MTLRLCSRSKDVIEPLLKPQWYVSMKDMAAKAYNAVESGELIINPKLSENEFKRWMENIRDWCISRQLWWGHQAPVYYIKVEGETQSVPPLEIVLMVAGGRKVVDLRTIRR